ncbi:hypothetical protein [Pseudoalteromonas sp. S2755]|uniref:hypothetical protein n=1 Tax=Pseudoalteromonas sp. S2755 TaxID=2066523 RepID=UPI00110C070F|nr:hypothetical protein [Pseudoalteromonas sp. S2755]TMN32949.1 hypothetical protein CWC03_21380 [Pseudoalteromonas sp. S2755]
MLKSLFLLFSLIIFGIPSFVEARASSICSPSHIEVALKHFSYCQPSEQANKVSFQTFTSDTYSVVISDNSSELTLSWITGATALAGLPNKYDLTPLEFMTRAFNGTFDIQSEDMQKVSAELGVIDEANVFTATHGAKHIFSSIRPSGVQTAYILQPNSDWLLRLDGKFDINTLMYVVDKLTLMR